MSGWTVVLASERGTAHARRGEPCQDACLAAAVGPALVAACADGAGTAPLADVGARAACLAAVTAAADALRAGLEVAAVDRAAAAGWFDAARRRLALEACRRGVPLKQLACTLLVAVADETHAAFGQLGDGAVVADGVPVFWPQSGEFANSTYFVTGDDYRDRFQFAAAGPVAELAVFTDGLQHLALRYETRAAHGPFFRPLFATLRAAHPDADVTAALRRWLQSAGVNARTDDDKTLVLAAR